MKQNENGRSSELLRSHIKVKSIRNSTLNKPIKQLITLTDK